MTAHARQALAEVVQRQVLYRSAASAAADSSRPLRVCHVMSADLWAGAEVQLATTAAYLMNRSDVSLTAVLLNEGPLALELRRLAVKVVVANERRLGAFGIMRFLAEFFKENDIELVHTHRYKDNVLGSMAAKLAGVPHIVRTVHGLREPMTGWNHYKFRAYEALDKAMLLCFADLVIAVSKRMADTLMESGYRPTMVTHIHNGVDLSRVAAARPADDVRAELGVDPDTLLIGTAGRLVPVKGHDSLLRAARLIVQQERRAKFLIVGAGPLERELSAAAAELHLDDACLFVGARPDVHDLMSAMDIFVLSSLDEGIPMAMLEAMALGKPIVATAVGGIPEVLQDHVSGLLVKAGDDSALADACLELARDRGWAQQLGAQAKRVVMDEFSSERYGQALFNAYNSVTVTTRFQSDKRPRVFSAGRMSPEHISSIDLIWGLVRKAAEYAARAVAHAIERRKMSRIRRNPAVLRAALRSASNLLIVCHGNVIRSPFATLALRQALGDRSPVSVSSAGLEAVPGHRIHPRALAAATTRNVDLSFHRPCPIAPDRVAASDVIFVMDTPQLVVMRKRFPDARRKTFLLTCLAPELPLEIEDPINGDEAVFQICFDHISRAVRPIARTLFASATDQQQAP